MLLEKGWFEDRREYRRVATGVRVLYRAHRLRKVELCYLTGVAENVGLGGMFIATPHPFPVSTLLTVEFQIRPERRGEPPVRAKALVRWRRRWRQPRGMGVQFVEFEGLGQRQLETWIETVFTGETSLA